MSVRLSIDGQGDLTLSVDGPSTEAVLKTMRDYVPDIDERLAGLLAPFRGADEPDPESHGAVSRGDAGLDHGEGPEGPDDEEHPEADGERKEDETPPSLTCDVCGSTTDQDLQELLKRKTGQALCGLHGSL